MNINLFNVVKQIVTNEGDTILSEPQRVSAFFADMAQDVPKAQKLVFIRCLEHGCTQILKNSPESERVDCKQKLAQKLHEEEALDLGLCTETLELLETVLFEEKQKKRRGLIDEVERLKGTMVIFFVIGISSSMDGSKIWAVNTAIREFIPEIKEVLRDNDDVSIKIAVLTFSNGARWITDYPVETEQFDWKNLEAEGKADFGAACKALNEKLSTKTFMQEVYCQYHPIIFLFSDSKFTDDWQNALAELKQNYWFRLSIKAAIAIGDDADIEVLEKFTDSPEAVITAHNHATLIRFIKFIDIDTYMPTKPAPIVSQKQNELNGVDNSDIW